MIALALAQDGLTLVGDPAPIGGRALLVSVVVVGLVALAAWVLRSRLSTVRGRQDFTVERALALGDRRTLVIVSVESRRLLLGMSPQYIGLITELQPAEHASFRQALDARIASEAVS
jgi:flagellar biogenesis protein FliO